MNNLWLYLGEEGKVLLLHQLLVHKKEEKKKEKEVIMMDIDNLYC